MCMLTSRFHRGAKELLAILRDRYTRQLSEDREILEMVDRGIKAAMTTTTTAAAVQSKAVPFKSTITRDELD